MKIDVALVAQDVTSQMVYGKNAVVIDVLRATSTMSTALSNGSAGIYPVTSPEIAFQMANSFEPGSYLIGGERGGIKAPGFDLGNSPREYTREAVQGKSIIMTTTNGTLAINNCKRAHGVYVCALLNASAVARRVSSEDEDVLVVCSGTQGVFTLEDAYCAGIVVDRVASCAGTEMSDMAMACRIVYERYAATPLKLMNLAAHGQHLRGLGFGQDLEYCAQIDLLDVVPILNGDVIVLC